MLYITLALNAIALYYFLERVYVHYTDMVDYDFVFNMSEIRDGVDPKTYTKHMNQVRWAWYPTMFLGIYHVQLLLAQYS